MKVLDHGSVTLIESWGSDERIVEAARMSTDKGFQGWGRCGDWRCGVCHYTLDASLAEDLLSRLEATGVAAREIKCPNATCVGSVLAKQPDTVGDEKLLRYLYEHKHATPFEMGGLTIEVQAPIFVFREWHRHRTQSYNELSARYTPLPDVNYLPSVERVLQRDIKNKQAMSTTDTLDAARAALFVVHLKRDYDAAERAYQEALSSGVPKELARLIIPVGRYSRMRASANLRNWLGFLTLRMDPAAQWEIRQYANAVGELIAAKFPRTWTLFDEGRK